MDKTLRVVSFRQLIYILVLLVLGGCSKLTYQDYSNNICKVVSSHYGWRSALSQTQKKYGISPGLVLSVIFHESSFKAEARPPKEKLLGFIPWQTATAYGYAQVKDETWAWYKSHNPGVFQSRNQFPDAVDFIAWYYKMFHLRLEKEGYDDDVTAADFYLAYHDGIGGFLQGTWREKQWVVLKAEKVAQLAEQYDQQLKQCFR
ncbi:MAG: transglycosylase SLT domain-containing protein [Pseudomonadota bacterium]|nr:transglycosylase SLT domain-containing protein [Pseudomonadota bacterium]